MSKISIPIDISERISDNKKRIYHLCIGSSSKATPYDFSTQGDIIKNDIFNNESFKETINDIITEKADMLVIYYPKKSSIPKMGSLKYQEGYNILGSGFRDAIKDNIVYDNSIIVPALYTLSTYELDFENLFIKALKNFQFFCDKQSLSESEIKAFAINHRDGAKCLINQILESIKENNPCKYNISKDYIDFVEYLEFLSLGSTRLHVLTIKYLTPSSKVSVYLIPEYIITK